MGAEVSAAHQRRSRAGMAAISSGETGVPLPPSQSAATPPAPVQVVEFSGAGALHADATVLPSAPVPIMPTLYPGELGGTVIVQNYITINVRSPVFRQSNTKLDELIDELRRSNQISAEVRDQLRAEITAGKALLAAPKPNRNLIELLLLRPLKYLADKAGSAIITKLAVELLNLLTKLLS